LSIPLDANGQALRLEATAFHPDGAGPFPLVVINHGSPRTAADRRAPRWRPVEQSRWFVSRGYAVIIPMRRGYACSQGDWAEGYGSCTTPDYFDAGLESARDIRATLDFMTA